MTKYFRIALLFGLFVATPKNAFALDVEPVLIDDRPEKDFKRLSNGKDLKGWDGNPKLWSVKDGAIVGQTTAENPAKGNTFLIWTNGTTGDFELRCSFKITPNNDKNFANSGIQYRSKVVDAGNWVVGGYQADFEAGKTYSGILYDEAGVAGKRGIMAARGEEVVWDKDCKKQVAGSVGNSDEIQASIKQGDWNDYVIIAKGNHLQHRINGRVTVDVTDDCEAKRLTSGVLALQLHAGPPMTVEFKNIRLKTFEKNSSKRSSNHELKSETETVSVEDCQRAHTDLMTSHNLAGASTKVAILNRLRDGRIEEAIGVLESMLDGDLIMLYTMFQSNPERKADEQATTVIKLVQEYRSKFPHKTNKPEIDSAVAKALN